MNLSNAPDGIFRRTPRAPGIGWMMSQHWRSMLLAHWPIAPELLRALIPPGLALDTHDGQAWLSLAALTVTRSRLRWLPSLPKVSPFLQLNAYTYVTWNGQPAFYLFSADTNSLAATVSGRLLYRLPYSQAEMRCTTDEAHIIEFSSRRVDNAAPAAFSAAYYPTGPAAAPRPRSLEHWLLARRWFYVQDHQQRLYRAAVHCPSVQLRAAEAAILENTLMLRHSLVLSDPPVLTSFVPSLPIQVGRPGQVQTRAPSSS